MKKNKFISLMLCVFILTTTLLGVFSIASNAASTTSTGTNIQGITTKTSSNSSIQPRSSASMAVKSAAIWLKSNWTKVYAKIPASVKAYFAFDKVSKALDLYINYSNTVDQFLTDVVNYLLPGYLEWMTPGIVGIIRFFLPI